MDIKTRDATIEAAIIAASRWVDMDAEGRDVFRGRVINYLERTEQNKSTPGILIIDELGEEAAEILENLWRCASGFDTRYGNPKEDFMRDIDVVCWAVCRAWLTRELEDPSGPFEADTLEGLIKRLG